MNTTIKILTLALITLLLNNQTINAQCHNDDWTALKQLYLSTNGDNWINNTDWQQVTSSAPSANCNLEVLYGVTLDDQGRIKTLDLSSNQLSGSLPAELGNLTNLEILVLENNQLSNNLPAELGNLTNLRELFLNNNELDGSLPAELGNLTNLVWLFLYDNKLDGSLPTELSNLSNLEILRLDNNRFSGNLPVELGNLTNLVWLFLCENQLDGSLPTELSNLTNLEVLRLDNNGFSGNLLAELGNLTNLRELFLRNNQLSGSLPAELGNLTNLVWLFLSDNQFNGSVPAELCDLTNLTLLDINDNNLQGCYPACMNVFCVQLNDPYFDSNSDISNGNNFDASWEDFCTTGAGSCTDVYPGDLNHDGIINNQDLGLWGLFKYETGPPRAPDYQNTDWDPYPAEDWNRLQINNEDIKHFDTNGNGVIEDDDCQAVTDNFGETWSPATTVEIPEPPEESDYQVMLHPIEQVFDGNLVMNVSLERRAGGSMEIRGGHFTVDYSDIEGDISTAALNFLPISWLGTPTINLWYESTPFPSEKRIEVGFTKINNVNSQGSGVIGQLILEYDNSGARLSENTDMYEFRVNTIGVHNSEQFTQMEDQVLQVNVDDSNYCQANWLIDENTPFQNQYKSDNDIETNGMVIIGDEQEVLYQADRITLNSGFSAKAGTDFEIKIGGCVE